MRRRDAEQRWLDDLARIEARIRRLRDALAGRADITEVEVKRVVVREHVRRAHTRLVIRRRR